MSSADVCFHEASIGPGDQPIFRDFSWNVEPFQSWVITGENGSGKSAIAQALAGGLAVASRAASKGAGNRLPDPSSVALISFERQRDVLFDERYHDDGEFVEGGIDPGTSARDFILGRKRGTRAASAPPPSPPARLDELVRRFLGASNDARRVIVDASARYFGAELQDETLLPRAGARLGSVTYETWLSRSQSAA